MDKDLQRVINEAISEWALNESSFRVYNDTLCPDLWDQCQHLDPRVRVNLLRIAYDFYKKTKFQAPIVDIWLMGSIANYNWTPESDADVHIILDFSQLKMPPETASKVAKAAGAMWNKEHDITVKNHKVELNIQSVKAEKPYVMGIYSLVKDEWVKHPQHLHVTVNKPLIQQKFSEVK
jgi:predicted nucleotidyltransferase